MSDVLPTRTLWGWGLNFDGELGDGTEQDRSSPVSVVGGFTDWIQLTSGYAGASVVARRENGTLWTWGWNGSGMLGDGTYSDKSSPVEVLGGFTDWVDVDSDIFVVAIRKNGTVWGWGFNNHGVFGYSPVPVGGGTNSPININMGYNDWVSAKAGMYCITAIRSNGELWTMGMNWSGVLGDNSTSHRSSPVSVAGNIRDWKSFATGWYHTIALRENGTLWSWGYNRDGELGDGTSISRSSPVSVVGGTTGWVEVRASNQTSGALKDDGTGYFWGYNTWSLALDGTNTHKSSPVSIQYFSDWIDFSPSKKAIGGIRQNGTLWAWGINVFGEAGDGTVEFRSSPVSVLGGITDWVSLSTRNNNILALRGNPIPEIPDGSTIWTWGRGYNGQLGRKIDWDISHPYLAGNYVGTVSRSPTKIASDINDWANVFAGTYTNFATRNDGTLWAWGDNRNGEMGIGNTNNDYTVNYNPKEVLGGFNDWIHVSSMRGESTLALRANGTMWGWGRNPHGQLGNGTNEVKSSPTLVVGGFTDWKQCATGYFTSGGLRENGTLWMWGRASGGALGNGKHPMNGPNPWNVVTENSPVSVIGGITDWSYFSIGDSVTAVRSSGELWIWGFNIYGMDGTTESRSSPVSATVGGFTDWDMVVSSGASNYFGLRRNGTLWSWGQNPYGQLGDGTVITKSSPVSVLGGFTDWVGLREAPAKFGQVGCRRANGSIWVWGFQGFNGLLGDGTDSERSSPVSVIGGFSDWKVFSTDYVMSLAILSKSDLPVSEIWRSAYPLIANESVNRVQELPLGDSLNLQGSSILNVEAINGQVISTTSDSRKKDSVHTLEHAGDLVDALRGVTFKWKKNDSDSMGLIAQEVEEVIPEVVHTSESGKSLSYGNMIGLLVEALKEQDIDILEIENMIKDMEGDKDV